jgi:Calcineurin-like phosphoesterase
MKPTKVFVCLIALVALVIPASHLQGQVSFPGTELLGRPTNDSVTINVVASTAIDAYFQYGTQSGTYTNQTNIVSAPANEPLVVDITGLQDDTRYYYRMVYRQTGTASWIARDEHSFHTRRLPGSPFTFTVTADSHVNIVFGNASLYQRTMLNVDADHPDFHLDLGDTFAMDNVTSQTQARDAYLAQRPYMGLVSHSAPIFLALGNHEEEEGWHRDDTGALATSKPILGANARKRYFLNPVPNFFYSGNTDSWPVLDRDHLPGDYYAWRWGNALFVVIDPYWYTTTKPFTGNTGGGESSDVGSGDRWDWTLGLDQYQWLKQTLETSDATFKFIFAHHGTGGTDDYIRGGANGVPYTEWGGRNEDGTTYAFGNRRPGWYAPVHQLLVQNRVTAFFHAHDHEFAHEKRDGVVYQLVPMAADSSYGYGSFQLYHETDPYTIRVLPNSGHLRVTVSPSTATVDYVRAFLPGAGTNGQVAYTYTMSEGAPDPTPPAPTTVTAFPSSAVIQSGTLRSGSAARLNADDNSYYEVNSTTFGTRTASAYARFSGVSNSLSNLQISFKGKNSQSCTQTIAVWRWTTNTWVQLDSRSVGTTEVAIANLAPSGAMADFVSGTSGNGELRVRVQCTRSSSFFSSWDQMQISYVRP